MTTFNQGVKDAPTPRSNKRPRLDPSLDETKPTKAGTAEKSKLKHSVVPEQSKSKKPAQLDEFMSVMKSRTKKGPSWADDGALLPAGDASADQKSRKDERPPFSPDADPEATEAVDDRGEGMSDLDWMRKRMSRAMEVTDDEKKEFVQSEDEESGKEVEVRESLFVLPRKTYEVHVARR